MSVLQISNSTYERKNADKALEDYVTITVSNVIAAFFNSPFSEQSTNVQVFVFLMLMLVCDL
jgi:inositol 1,4,5-triphosphate receptor type 1